MTKNNYFQRILLTCLCEEFVEASPTPLSHEITKLWNSFILLLIVLWFFLLRFNSPLRAVRSTTRRIGKTGSRSTHLSQPLVLYRCQGPGSADRLWQLVVCYPTATAWGGEWRWGRRGILSRAVAWPGLANGKKRCNGLGSRTDTDYSDSGNAWSLDIPAGHYHFKAHPAD